MDKTILNNDRIFEAYSGKMGLAFQRLTHERFAWIAKNISGTSLLDIGCSQGIFDIILGREGKKVTALDIDSTVLEFAHSLLEKESDFVKDHVQFLLKNYLEFESSEQYTDVILGEVLEHVVYPEIFIKKSFDLLKEGGHLIVTLPFGKNEHYDHKRTYYLSAFLRLLENKFEVLDIAYIGRWVGISCIKNSTNCPPHTLSLQQLDEFERSIEKLEEMYIEEIGRQKTSLHSFKETSQDLAESRLQIDSLQLDLVNNKKELQLVTMQRDTFERDFIEMNQSAYSAKMELERLNKNVFLRFGRLIKKILTPFLPKKQQPKTPPLIVAEPPETYEAILRTIDTETKWHLLITDNYPSDTDIYKNMFIHTRVAYYQKQRLPVIVFVLNNAITATLDEYEGICVLRGNQHFLSFIIENLNIAKFLVHFINPEIYQAISETNKDTIIWVHGAEAQSWRRRLFNLRIKDVLHFKRFKAYLLESKKREEFFRSIVHSPKLPITFVIVSKWFKEDIEKDLHLKFNNYVIIPNFINDKEFPYQHKDSELRKKILSIRPYASRKYANDLTVKAILALSKKRFFSELSFTIAGDGPLFDSTTAPLQQFPNVTLIKRFLSHKEIKVLHEQHGVFLCPTRMDAQGVSLCESLSSGLVGVSSYTTAIPEFVTKQYGLFAPPGNSSFLALQIERLYKSPELFHQLSELGSIKISEKCGATSTVDAEIQLIASTPNTTDEHRSLSEFKVALISDEFTYNNIKDSVNIKRLTQDNYKELAEWCDIFLIESAWHGNGGEWTDKICNLGTRDNTQIKKILRYFKQRGIKTVFWNKEDPFHFDGFIDTAKSCEYVFTTDSSIIQQYKEYGCKKVFALPFFFNPNIFNPIADIERENSVVYAGSYYGDKFPERKMFMDSMIANFKKYGLTIFDRNFGNPTQDYAFPPQFKKYIKGTLPPNKIYEAYKGYRVNINTNSITLSNTMFARRVIEIMACNSPIISSESHSMKTLFPFVLSSDNNHQISSEIEKLFTDEEYYRRKQIQGVREAFRNYTADTAMYRLLYKIGFSIKLNRPHITVRLLDSENKDLAERLLQQQSYKNFSLETEQGTLTGINAVLESKYLENTHLFEDLINAYQYIGAETVITIDPNSPEYTYISKQNPNCYFEYVSNPDREQRIFNLPYTQ